MYHIEVRFLEPSVLGIYSSCRDLVLKATQLRLDTTSANGLLHMVPWSNGAVANNVEKWILSQKTELESPKCSTHPQPAPAHSSYYKCSLLKMPNSLQLHTQASEIVATEFCNSSSPTLGRGC